MWVTWTSQRFFLLQMLSSGWQQIDIYLFPARCCHQKFPLTSITHFGHSRSDSAPTQLKLNLSHSRSRPFYAVLNLEMANASLEEGKTVCFSHWESCLVDGDYGSTQWCWSQDSQSYLPSSNCHQAFSLSSLQKNTIFCDLFEWNASLER